jgi:hypothetical protein
MTLTALRIANFKAFADVQRVPLRPITLIYGANSAGKSSILHALALAHHAVETGELDTQRTQIGGESIDLGGFRQYVHRRERERQVELTFEIDPGRLAGRVAELLAASRRVAVEIAIGSVRDRQQPAKVEGHVEAELERFLVGLLPGKADALRRLVRELVVLGLVIAPAGKGLAVKIMRGSREVALARPSLLILSENGDVEIVAQWLRRDLRAAVGDSATAIQLTDDYLRQAEPYRVTHSRWPRGHFYDVRGREKAFAAVVAAFAGRIRRLVPDRDVNAHERVTLTRFAVEADGALLLSMSARAGGLLRLDRLDHAHPVFRELFRGLLMLATTTQQVRAEDFATLGEVLDGLVPGITARAGGLFPRIEEESAGGETERQREQAFVPVSRGRRQEDLARAACLFLPKALRDLVAGLGVALEDEIRRLCYLGPLRSYPPRHLAFSQEHDPNWFAGGGYAWDVVRRREDVRRRVNAWLGDASRLKTPYELEVRHLFAWGEMAALWEGFAGRMSQEQISRLFKRGLVEELRSWPYEEIWKTERDPEAWKQLMEGLSDRVVDPEELRPALEAELGASGLEAIQELVLVDKRSGTRVTHRDVGIGVSQVLPVLVAAYASKGKLLAVEQPEIHLHPALQAELGDVFLGAALGEGANTLLIESHSEHLLLRIMRRMRETFEGTLPEGLPQVHPEDVMVLFIEPDGPKSIVREMPLNERGELVKAWPGGFFEEGLREVF